MKSGILSPDLQALKKIGGMFVATMGVYASHLTIIQYHKDKAAEEKFIAETKAAYQESLDQAQNELKQVQNKQVATNFINGMNIRKIDRNFAELNNQMKKKSELMKLIEEKKCTVYSWTGGTIKNNHRYELQRLNVKLQEAEHKVKRAVSETNPEVAKAKKYNEDISKVTDEQELLELINNINKSSIFYFDLEELWNRFDALDGLTKVVYSMMFSNYLILSFLYGIAINLYGNYLIERFKLEEKYRK